MSLNSPFHYSSFFEDTGIFDSLFNSYEYPWQVMSQIDDFITGFRDSELSKDYDEIEKFVFIGKNVSIDDTARIQGKAIIGHNSFIGHAALLRNGVLLGENVHVGHAVEVKHSIILKNTALAHLNYIGDSIVGSDNNISGGAILANSRLDRNEIKIKTSGEPIYTGQEKLGSILGDRCFIGANAVLNPGTVLAKESVVFPLISVKGTHLQTQTFK